MLFQDSSLDEIYVHINSLYVARNQESEAAPNRAVLRAIAEHGGALTAAATGRHQHRSSPEEVRDHGLRALAWLLTGAGSIGWTSVEAVLWDKFPYACPYCRKCPHVARECKDPRRPSKEVIVDWEALRPIRDAHEASKPRAFFEWLLMFDDIYGQDIVPEQALKEALPRFAEEGSELATALRVSGLSVNQEWADCIAWLSRILLMNEMRVNPSRPGAAADVTEALVRKYHSCPDCGKRPCSCGYVTDAVLQRAVREAAPPSSYVTARSDLSRMQAVFRFGATEWEVSGTTVSIGQPEVEALAEFLVVLRHELELHGADDQDAVVLQSGLAQMDDGKATLLDAIRASQAWFNAGSPFAERILVAVLTKVGTNTANHVVDLLAESLKRH